MCDIVIQEIVNIPFIEEYKETEKYSYKIDIPLTKYENINKEIKEYIYNSLDNFLQYDNDSNIKYDFYTDYDIYNYNGIAFYIIKIYQFIGGVHYGILYKEFTYDNEGNSLLLRDFFNSDNYLKEISNIAYKEVLNKYSDVIKCGLKKGQNL